MKIIAIDVVTPTDLHPTFTIRISMQRFQRRLVRLFHPYQPWRHYMRGPGPKWREKHGLTAQ